MADDRRIPESAQPQYDSAVGCLPRIFWMFIGNVALFMAAAAVYASAGWSIADVVYWLIVGLLICARYIDIVRFKGKTTDGEPATTTHLKRYALMVLLVGAALWAAARALGPGFA